VYAKYQRHIQHEIFLWKNADIINLKSYIFDTAKTFIEVDTIGTKINSLLEHFSNMCQELIDERVQSKMTSVRYSQILINTEINRLPRKARKKTPKILEPLYIHQREMSN
jgi:hypothetical protein